MNDFRNIDSGYHLPPDNQSKGRPLIVAFILFVVAVATVLFLFRHLDSASASQQTSRKATSNSSTASDLQSLTPDPVESANVTTLKPAQMIHLHRPVPPGGL